MSYQETPCTSERIYYIMSATAVIYCPTHNTPCFGKSMLQRLVSNCCQCLLKYVLHHVLRVLRYIASSHPIHRRSWFHDDPISFVHETSLIATSFFTNLSSHKISPTSIATTLLLLQTHRYGEKERNGKRPLWKSFESRTVPPREFPTGE
jgi:hypothetical protein